jgi:CRISPR-associated protein Cmr6
MEYPIPKMTTEAWLKHQEKSGQNPGLIFDRFAPKWEGQPTLKKYGLEAVQRASERGKVEEAILAAWTARWEAVVRHTHAAPFPSRTDWRFIAGLGRKGPLEVGFTFHRYGFPILPGSSVKGIARAWGLIALAAALEADRLQKLDELLSIDEERKFLETFKQTYPQASAQDTIQMQEFRLLFGATSGAGRAVFFDAIPARLPKLELDIMNPHFPDYYGDKNNKVAPTDWQSPRPVPFLTVAPNSEFRFAVGWRGALNDETRHLRDLARDWLMKGLTDLGAGAKTSAGYGHFLE